MYEVHGKAETLADIARKTLGSSTRLSDIHRLNPNLKPDVAVVRGSPRDYLGAAPTDPALVVEISQTSLALDRARKASIYARAGIADYWIVNLVDAVVEVRRDLVALDPARPRRVYQSVRAFGRGASLSPLASPGARIPITDLLP